MKDWYHILQISENATEEAVKNAYRKLAKKYHPDAHAGDRECERRFQEISEAYSILSDSKKRRAYDEERRRTPQSRNAQKASTENRMHKAEAVDFQNISKSFEKFFGFNPDTRDIVNEKKLNPGSHDPLDATALFEKFMGIK